MDNKKLIVALLCLGNIAISFNVAAVAASIPFISQDLGLTDLVVSKIVPFYMIPYGIGALLYAPLTRYFTYRTILAGAMLLYAVMSLVSGLSLSLNHILLAQIGAGVVGASSTPLSLMIIGELFEKNVRGRLVGAYFGFSFVASVIGMIFMALVKWNWLFLIPGGIALLNAVLWLVCPVDGLSKKHNESVNYLKAFFKDHIRTVFLFIFCMSFLYHGVHKWYGVYLSREYGLGKEGISLMLIASALCGLTGQQIGGFLSDKKGRLTACFTGLILLSMGVMLLAGHYPVVMVAAVLGVISIGWTVCHNSVSTILTDFPEDDRPITASLNSAVRFVSGGLGFSVSKFFVEKDFGMTFLVIGVLMLSLIFYARATFVESR